MLTGSCILGVFNWLRGIMIEDGILKSHGLALSVSPSSYLCISSLKTNGKSMMFEG
jgi:hypothetical protein